MDTIEILKARNHFKERRQVYVHRDIWKLAAQLGKQTIDKESSSMFAYACVLLVMGKLGCKFSFLSEEDKQNINKLHVCMTYYR